MIRKRVNLCWNTGNCWQNTIHQIVLDVIQTGIGVVQFGDGIVALLQRHGLHVGENLVHRLSSGSQTR